MTKLEKLVQTIMAGAIADGEPVTEEEAREMAEMEIKAKGLKNYAQADKPKAKTKREPKIDNDKIELVKRIENAFKTGDIQSLKTTNAQREITFTFNGNSYSITLVKHRKK